MIRFVTERLRSSTFTFSSTSITSSRALDVRVLAMSGLAGAACCLIDSDCCLFDPDCRLVDLAWCLVDPACCLVASAVLDVLFTAVGVPS